MSCSFFVKIILLFQFSGEKNWRRPTEGPWDPAAPRSADAAVPEDDQSVLI
jgi:hypothetical protein